MLMKSDGTIKEKKVKKEEDPAKSIKAMREKQFGKHEKLEV